MHQLGMTLSVQFDEGGPDCGPVWRASLLDKVALDLLAREGRREKRAIAVQTQYLAQSLRPGRS